MSFVPSHYEYISEQLILCEHIFLSEGELLEVYIGTSGIYVISEPVENPDDLYIAVRKLLETARFKLFIQDHGEYQHTTSSFVSIHTIEELSAAVNDYVTGSTVYFNAEARSELCTKLLSVSALYSGSIQSPDGSVYISHNGKYRKVSSHSSTLQFYLTLFGGVLGLHQFALHKYGLGFLYLFTGGGFTLGWLMDILLLFLGLQKDKSYRYLSPLTHRLRKFVLVPFGLFFGFLLFRLYRESSVLLLQNADLIVRQQVQSTDSSFFQSLYYNLQSFAEYLSK